jgi:uncharacterized membrane protein YbaN (DUF454 family)
MSPTKPRWQRVLWVIAGAIALALAALGIFLPLLPTTPLVLLAAFCFARGSQRAHRWLLEHRVFGPIVMDWQRHRRVSRRVKGTAIALVVLAFAFSWVALPSSVLGRVILVTVGLALVIFLVTLPSGPRPQRGGE